MKVLIFARLTYAVFFNRLLTKLPFDNIHAWCTKLPSCQTATFVQRTSDLQVLPESDRVLSFHHYLFHYLHQSIICERASTTQQRKRSAR